VKVKITYETDAELQEALRRSLQKYIDEGAKLSKSARYPPYKHAYLTIKKPENARNTGNPA
jgi:hypothetical protein